MNQLGDNKMICSEVTNIATENVTSCPLCGLKECGIMYRGLQDRFWGAPGKWNLRQCIDCGLLYLDPRPAPEHVSKVYPVEYAYRKVANKIKRTNFLRRINQIAIKGFLSNRYGYRKKGSFLQRIFSLPFYLLPAWCKRAGLQVLCLPYKPDHRLLDVGCGTGEFLERMIHLGWQAEGIDTNPHVIEICKGRGLPAQVGALEEQNYPDDRYYAITLRHVLEHVPDPIKLLEECRRILKPGGRLAVLTPNLNSIGHRVLKNSWSGLDVPRHMCIFNTRTLYETAQKSGLRIEDMFSTSRSAGFNWLVSCRGQSAYRNKPSLMDAIKSRIFEKMISLILLLNNEAGEELLMIATK